MVFKKWGKLKATDRKDINVQNIEVADKFNYLGVMSESMTGWSKLKTPATAKGY